MDGELAGPLEDNQRVSNVAGDEGSDGSEEIALKNGVYRGQTIEADDPNGGTARVYFVKLTKTFCLTTNSS